MEPDPGSEATVRPASAQDADALAVVQVASWRAAYAGLMPADFLAGLDVSARAARWREILAGDTASTVVAESGGRIVGFVSVGPDPAEPQSPTGVLYAIYLEPASWGRGIGHALHEVGLQRLRDRGFTAADLWLLRGNLRALHFYERHGWTPNGRDQIDRHFPGVELDEIGYRHEL